jgi:aryl-alcohol dehydrogenase-like predicted oxidoreductase
LRASSLSLRWMSSGFGMHDPAEGPKILHDPALKLPFATVGRKDPLRVSKVGMGLLPLCVAGRPMQEDAVGVLHAAIDAGITLFDTSDVFCMDHGEYNYSERLVQRALSSYSGPEDVGKLVVAGKGGLRRLDGVESEDGSHDAMFRACEASLQALGRDCMDIYSLQRVDRRVGLEKQVETLAKLREQGMINKIGLCDVGSDDLALADAVVPIDMVTNRFSALQLADHLGTVLYCADKSIAFVAHSPLGGMNTGAAQMKQNETVQAFAAKMQCSAQEVSLFLVMALYQNLCVIPGMTSLSDVESCKRALALEHSPHMGDFQQFVGELMLKTTNDKGGYGDVNLSPGGAAASTNKQQAPGKQMSMEDIVQEAMRLGYNEDNFEFPQDIPAQDVERFKGMMRALQQKAAQQTSNKKQQRARGASKPRKR